MTSFYGSSVPPKSKEYQNQTAISSITDEVFDEIRKPYKTSGKRILYQVICFLLFLGPVRLVFSLFVFIFCWVVIICIRIFLNTIQLPRHTFRDACLSIARFGIRCILFGFGIVYVKTDGRLDHASRFVIANRIGLLDAFVILIFQDLSVPVDVEYRSFRPLQLLLDCVDPVYVNFRNAQQCRHKIYNTVNDFTNPPVLVFPEGEASRACGEVLTKFHKTAFATPYKIQPITMRYHMLGVPKGWNTYAYRGEQLVSYFWRLISMPPSVLSLHFLPTMRIDSDGKSDIATFANAAQLSMANFMGVQAVDRKEERRKKIYE